MKHIIRTLGYSFSVAISLSLLAAIFECFKYIHHYGTRLPNTTWFFFGLLLFVYFGLFNWIVIFLVSMVLSRKEKHRPEERGFPGVLAAGIVLVLWEIAVGKLFREVLPEQYDLTSPVGLLIFAGVSILAVVSLLLLSRIRPSPSSVFGRIGRFRAAPSLVLPVLLALLACALYPLSGKISGFDDQGIEITTDSDVAGKPHVILIVLDTARWDHLSCYGYHRPTTPNIDEIAGRGLLFSRAIAPSPYTSPSHASLFTGTYPSTHGVKLTNRFLVPNNLTLAEIFRGAGYRTAGIVSNVNLISLFGFEQGFEIYDDDPVWSRNIVDYWFQWSVLGRFFFKFRTIIFMPMQGIGRRIQKENTASVTNKRVFDTLDANGDAPLFLFVNYIDPHFPYAPPADHGSRFPLQYEGWIRRLADHELSLALMVQGKLLPPDALETDRPLAFRQEDWNYLVTRYDEEMYYLDAHVGKLHAFLEEKGYLDNYIMVIVSDHGEHFGEHDLALHANSLYESLLHIPLIVTASEKVAPGTVEEYVSLVDIPITLLSYAGIPVPDTFGGRDLLQAAGGDAPPRYPVGELANSRSLHAGSYKAIFDEGKTSLYNLDEDPEEKTDRASDFPEVVEEMTAIMREWEKSQSRIKGIREGVELDQALRDQLRALGYVN